MKEGKCEIEDKSQKEEASLLRATAFYQALET